MHPFIDAGYPGKEKAALLSCGEQTGCPMECRHNWTFAPQAIDVGKMESNLLWETLCNIPFKKKKFLISKRYCKFIIKYLENAE